MKLARFGNVIAIKTATGEVVGFHARNMQTAILDEAAWQALQNPEAAASEAQQEIAEWNEEIDPAAVDADIPQAVRTLGVNISQLCNLKCTYCAAGGDGTYGDPVKSADLPVLFEQIRALLHDVIDGESFTINFLGGEPLMVPEAVRSVARFTRLQAAGRNIDVRFALTTNATLVTPAIAEMLASIGCHVTVSIDGAPEINDRHRPARGGKSSTALAVRGLGELQKVRARLGSLNVSSVFGSHNTDVLGTYEFLRQFDFDRLKLDFAASADDGAVSLVYANEFAKAAEAIFAKHGEAELRKITLFEAFFRSLDNQSRVHNYCGAGKSYLHSDARGSVSVCHWFSGDTREKIGQGAQIESEKLSPYSTRLTDLNDCRSCWARHMCGGGCMFVNRLKSGSKHQRDEAFCQRTRTLIGKAIEIYAKARTENREGGRREAH